MEATVELFSNDCGNFKFLVFSRDLILSGEISF